MSTPLVEILTNMNGRLRANVQAYIIKLLELPPKTKIGSRIGTPSANGIVYELGNDSKKVLKLSLKDEPYKADFNNEVRVGRIPGIEKVGTRIYQAAYSGLKIEEAGPYPVYLGVYVMDHLKGGDANSQVITLDKYVKRHYGKSCPATKDSVLKMYVDLIFQFYKVTKGWHADLHAENIQVILRKDGTVKTMKVIDYGSHTPFKRNISKLTCLDDVLDAINRNWNSLSSKPAFNKPWGGWPLVHKEPENKNKNQLLHANSAAIRNAGMHSMYHMAKKRKLTNGSKGMNLLSRVGLKYRVTIKRRKM